MAYDLEVNGRKTRCAVSYEGLSYETVAKNKASSTVHLEFADIIGVEESQNPKSEKLTSVILHHIDRSNSPKWTSKTIKFTGPSIICQQFVEDINGRLNELKDRPRSLLVIVNPKAGCFQGDQDGKKVYETIVEPLFRIAKIKTDLIYTEKERHVTDIVTHYDLSTIDGIILGGSDGTFHECINALLKRTQTESGVDINNAEAEVNPIPVPIGLIPIGFANGNAEGCYGCVDATTATLRIIRGNKESRNLGAAYSSNRLLSYFGLIVSYGVISEMMHAVNHQTWLGVARYLFVPIYHLLFKPQPEMDLRVTIQRAADQEEEKLSKEKKNSIPEKGSHLDDKSEDKTEVFEGRYTNASMFVGDPTDDDFTFDIGCHEGNRCLLTLSKPCSRLTFLDGLAKIMNKCSNAFQLSHMENYKVTKYKVEAKPVGMESINLKLDVDGETFYLETPEFEVRMLYGAVKVFSADKNSQKQTCVTISEKTKC